MQNHRKIRPRKTKKILLTSFKQMHCKKKKIKNTKRYDQVRHFHSYWMDAKIPPSILHTNYELILRQTNFLLLLYMMGQHLFLLSFCCLHSFWYCFNDWAHHAEKCFDVTLSTPFNGRYYLLSTLYTECSHGIVKSYGYGDV